MWRCTARRPPTRLDLLSASRARSALVLPQQMRSRAAAKAVKKTLQIWGAREVEPPRLLGRASADANSRSASAGHIGPFRAKNAAGLWWRQTPAQSACACKYDAAFDFDCALAGPTVLAPLHVGGHAAAIPVIFATSHDVCWCSVRMLEHVIIEAPPAARSSHLCKFHTRR